MIGLKAVQLIRTYVPLLVMYVVTWLASLGINVDSDTQVALTTAIAAVAAAAYYALIAALEKKWPALGKWGLGLGASGTPEYKDPVAGASAGDMHTAKN